jgi:Fur family ferric uptake transcriptional regulator
MKAQGESVGLSTVYRNLQALAEIGEVDFIRNQDGETLYRHCGSVHHHHLVCRQCGKAEELAGTTVEKWVSRVASDHGFTQLSHEVEIFGLCPRCTSRRAAETPKV